jgi:hypothetical protein
MGQGRWFADFASFWRRGVGLSKTQRTQRTQRTKKREEAHILMLRLPASLYTILQIFSLTLFEKTPILQALSRLPPLTTMPDLNHQPNLPGFLTGQ